MSGNRGLTIALAGGVGSGKSTIARKLASRLDAAVTSFGDYVRHVASKAGESIERSNLQRIGQELVEADAHGFAQAFLEWAPQPLDRPLIIDGVRHVIINDALRAWATASDKDYVLILLDVPVRQRAARRRDGNEEKLRRIDDHPVEREASDRLPGVANLIVSGSGTPDEVLARIAAAAPGPLARRLMAH